MKWLPNLQAPYVATMITEHRVWDGSQYLAVDMPFQYTDAMLRKRYLRQSNPNFTEAIDCPVWWLNWKSTQDWISSLQRVDTQVLQKMQELDYLFDDSLSDAEFARRHGEYKKGLAA